MVALFGLFGAAQAKADTQIEEGMPFTVDFKNNNEIFVFTAPETGTLYVDVTPYHTPYDGGVHGNFLFSDPECQQVINPVGAPQALTNGYRYTFRVEAGKNYYCSLYHEMLLESRTFVFTMSAEAIKPFVTMVYPPCGEDVYYDFALGIELQVNFNMSNVECSGVVMNYTTVSGEEKSIDVDYYKLEIDNSWRIDVKRAIDNVKDELERGCKFSIVIKNVKGDGEGPTGQYAVGNDIVLPYVYTPMTVAVKSTWPETFLSYWPEGDPAGIATIEFDGPLAPLADQPKAGPNSDGFSFQIHEGNDIESETGFQLLPDGKVTIEGNVLTLDFTGVTRKFVNPADEVVTILVQQLMDANGFNTYYGGSNQIAQEIKYKDLEQITLSYELTPMSGSLANTAEIELWIANETFEHVDFEGFAFECGDNSVVVSIEECTVTPDPEDANNYTLIYIPVPEIAKTSPNVTLKAVMTSLDGNEYSLTAAYENPVTDDPDTSGVSGIEAENGPAVIYNLQGIQVKNNNLPAGIYIINGKKVMVSNK